VVQGHHGATEEANHHQLVITILLVAADIRDPDLLRKSIVTVIKRTAESPRLLMIKDLIEVTEVRMMKGL
jgi:hypothetical protein